MSTLLLPTFAVFVAALRTRRKHLTTGANEIVAIVSELSHWTSSAYNRRYSSDPRTAATLSTSCRAALSHPSERSSSLHNSRLLQQALISKSSMRHADVLQTNKQKLHKALSIW
jgi:hypothetical protein